MFRKKQKRANITEKIDKILYKQYETKPFEVPKAIEMNYPTYLKLIQECNEHMTPSISSPAVHKVLRYKGLEIRINNSLKNNEIVIIWENKYANE